METWTGRNTSAFKGGYRYSLAAQLIRLKLFSNRSHGIDLLCTLITLYAEGKAKWTFYMQKDRYYFYTDNVRKSYRSHTYKHFSL